jgi:hypothetical protein
MFRIYMRYILLFTSYVFTILVLDRLSCGAQYQEILIMTIGGIDS